MMTETEYRRAFHLEVACNGEDAAVELAKRAGLEFAPEPVRLPERISYGPAVDCGGNFNCHLYSEGDFRPRTREEHFAIYAAAKDRYNAYPGLRVAAEGLVKAIDNGFKGLWEQWHINLKVELAKGPK